MQPGEVWLSIGLGAGLGVLYVAASFVSNKRALRSEQRFLIIVVTSMLIRILIALVCLIGAVLLLPVAPSALLGSFFVMFIVGLAVEVWLLHSRGASPE